MGRVAELKLKREGLNEFLASKRGNLIEREAISERGS